MIELMTPFGSLVVGSSRRGKTESMVGEVVGKDIKRRTSKVIESLASSVLGFSTCVTVIAIQGI